ncbi:MAG: hypothetical protein ACUVUF_08420 [Candidatus Bathycorpusculaceae bacterium]
MQVINKTSLPISLNDLTDKQEWKVEYGKDFNLPIKLVQPLDDWKVIVRWKNGKRPFSGFCNSSQKLIVIAINPKNAYPLTQKFAVGTEQVYPGAYRYIYETITFHNPNELIHFIFLHEFSHLLDYLRGLNLRFKQTKANRFALTNWKR